MPSPPLSAQSATRWWVYSEEDDGQVIEALTAQQAVKQWAASLWTDVEDNQAIHAFDLSLEHHFVAHQVNEISDDDLTTAPEFTFASDEERNS